jgi:hypothetical protein
VFFFVAVATAAVVLVAEPAVEQQSAGSLAATFATSLPGQTHPDERGSTRDLKRGPAASPILP